MTRPRSELIWPPSLSQRSCCWHAAYVSSAAEKRAAKPWPDLGAAGVSIDIESVLPVREDDTGGNIAAPARLPLRVLQVDGAGFAARLGKVIGQALAHGRRRLVFPGDRALFEADRCLAALLRLDQALALGFVKGFDGAEKFHGGVSFFAGVARIGRPAARRR